MSAMQPFRPQEVSYAGVGLTFCRVPLVLEPSGLQGADVAILGAPFDEGVSFRPGARFGPRAIRAAEDVGGGAPRPHMELGIDPLAELRIVDYGDIEAVPGALERSHERLLRHVSEILAAKAIPIVLGGDHSLSYPVLKALADHLGPDGYAVIHFDSHADTGAEIFGVTNSHGTPFYRAVAEGSLRGDHIMQIGLRGAWPGPDEFAWMREHGFRWRTMDEVLERGVPAVI